MLIATYFRAINTKIGDLLYSNTHKNFNFIGYLRRNNWQGRDKVDFIIEDVIVED